METPDDVYIPHEVVSLMVDHDWGIIRAWREHLGLSLQEVATRLGISQSAYAQQEANPRTNKANCEKIAPALGVHIVQLTL